MFGLELLATLGTTIQSAYAWVAYNRDNFAMNVGWRQAQQYQQRNYQMSWVAIAREDIHDMMGVSVHHTANYLMVSTLIFSAAVLCFATATFSGGCPTFVMFGFYTSGATSVIFLMLAIMFGVKGQNSAYENTVRLLTTSVRPENPDETSHNYMGQSLWIERLGLRSLFRPLGIGESYGVDVEAGAGAGSAEPGLEAAKPGKPKEGSAPVAPPAAAAAAAAGGEAAPVEVLAHQKHALYITSFQKLMRLWKPHDDFCKVCMGLGVVSFGQASAYFTTGKLTGYSGHSLQELLSCTTIAAFIFITVVIVRDLRRGSMCQRLALPALLVGGPGFAAVGAASSVKELQAAVVPLSFMSHLLFWAVALWIAIASADAVGQPHKNHDDHGGAVAGATGEATPNPEQAATRKGDPQQDADLAAATQPDSVANAAASGGEAGAHGTNFAFPEEESFELRSAAKQLHGKRTVIQAIVVSGTMWLAMLAWAIVHYSIQPFLSNVAQFEQLPVAKALALDANWPDRLYRPQTLACAGGRVFTSDNYRIFEIFPGDAPAVEVPCPGLQSPIADLSAMCDAQGCHPVALVQKVQDLSASQAAPFELVDCSGALGVAPFAQEPKHVEHLAVIQSLSAPRLLATHAGNLVQYSWAANGESWLPEWNLGSVSNVASSVNQRDDEHVEGLRAISSAGSVAMFFHGANGKETALVARSILSMQVVGRWTIPDAFVSVGGGCAISDREALMLVASGASEQDAPHTLVHVNLS